MKKLTPAFFLFSLTLAASPAFASSTTISNASTSQQSLGSGDSLTVTSTGSVTNANTGDKNVVSVNGNATINNSGTLHETSTDTSNSARAVRIDSGNLTLTNSSTGVIETDNADAIQGKSSSSTVTINNSGKIEAPNIGGNGAGGGQAIDFNGITTGANTINNFSTGQITSSNADAVRPGVNGVVNNDGIIKSTVTADTGTDGIDAQSNSGITITNAAGLNGETVGPALIEGARHGITGGNTSGTGAFAMSITNNAGGTIQGDNGSGVNIDGINGNELVTVVNHGTITGHGVTGDGDGVDVDGLVNLTNTGTIKSINAVGSASEGVTVGGGTIVNSGTIEGDVAAGNNSGALGVGITLAGIDSTNPISGIYGNTTVTNSGKIRGQTGAGIQATGAANSFTIKITNQAGGVIEGGGTGAAIALSGNDDTVINSGTIEADTSGKAVDLGAGTNSFQIVGGTAVVTGDISGGTGSTNSSMTVDAGAGNSFSYSGAISNFTTVETKTGTFNLSGSITGATTTVDAGSELHLAQGTVGAVTLKGTLSGNGTVGALNIGAGSTLSPGNSPGLIHASNTVFGAGGNFLLQVNTDGSTGAAGMNWDQLAVNGSLDVSGLGSSKTFNFELQNLGASFDGDTNHLWTDVITTTGGFVGNLNTSDFAIDTSLFPGSADGTFSIVRDASNSNDLDLEYTAAPEPTTWAMLLGGFGLLAFVQRLRRKISA